MGERAGRLQLAPDLGMLALVGRDRRRLRCQLVGIGLFLVALEGEDHVGDGARAEQPREADDQPDSRPRPAEWRYVGAGGGQPLGPDLGVTALIARDPLEGLLARRLLFDLGQRVVEHDRVALEFEVGQAACLLVGRQHQRGICHRREA
jgi:hypothetical protein